MEINQFGSEQFLKKMEKRLEWAPNGCDIGNKRGLKCGMETMRAMGEDCCGDGVGGTGDVFSSPEECDGTWRENRHR
jgi:hypothetical protein